MVHMVHMVLWGSANTDANTLDMRVGLAGQALRRLGLSGLPHGYVLSLPLQVRATIALQHAWGRHCAAHAGI